MIRWEWFRLKGITTSHGGTLFTAMLLIAWSCFAHASAGQVFDKRWCEHTSPNFRLISDLNDRKAARLLDKMERFHQVAHEMLGQSQTEAAEPLKVLVFAHRKDFRRVFASDHFAGFMRSSLHENLLVLGPDDGGNHLDENALHEYAHHVMRHSSVAAYPLWYEEGYASFLATMRFSEDSAIIGSSGKYRNKRYHVSDAQRDIVVRKVRQMTNIKRHRSSNFQAMLRARSMVELPPEQINSFYTDSWLLVHLLNFGQDAGFANRTEEVKGYLADVAAGDSHTTAYQNNFTHEPRQLHRDFKRYKVRLQLPTRTHPIKPRTSPLEIETQCLTAADTAYHLGLASTALNLRFANDASDWLREAEEVERAHIVSAVERSAAGDHASAAEFAEQALALDNDNVQAKVLLARATLERCQQAERCREEWENALDLYHLAWLDDQSRADTAFGLGVTHFLLDRVDDAVRYLEAAHRSAPWAPRISLFLGEAYRLAGQEEPARVHLQRAAKWEANASWRAKAQMALNLIDD